MDGEARTRVRLGLAVVALLLMVLPPPVALGATRARTIRVDVSNAGKPSAMGAIYESVSASGRFVAFETSSALVKGDTNGDSDVYVRDRRTHTTERVSVRSNGGQGNSWSGYAAISSTGRYVTFSSEASNLVPGDTNGYQDVFVHDRVTGKTTLVSLSSGGRQGNGDSDYSMVSANGRYVTFASVATNLVRGDTNGYYDLFLHDRATGKTRLITRSPKGAPANGNSTYTGPSMLSADGRYLAFDSSASNLVKGDANGASDVFVYDRVTGRIRIVSVSSAEVRGDSGSHTPTISAGGRYVVFTSAAKNLVGNDTNGYDDIFLRDLARGTTRRMSVSSKEVQSNGFSGYATVSSDGRYVAFDSLAKNLIGSDTNNVTDVFVRDVRNGTTRRVSVGPSGVEGDGQSEYAFIAASGSVVVFQSRATNLVANDMNAATDIFLRGPLR